MVIDSIRMFLNHLLLYTVEFKRKKKKKRENQIFFFYRHSIQNDSSDSFTQELVFKKLKTIFCLQKFAYKLEQRYLFPAILLKKCEFNIANSCFFFRQFDGKDHNSAMQTAVFSRHAATIFSHTK